MIHHQVSASIADSCRHGGVCDGNLNCSFLRFVDFFYVVFRIQDCDVISCQYLLSADVYTDRICLYGRILRHDAGQCNAAVIAAGLAECSIRIDGSLKRLPDQLSFFPVCFGFGCRLRFWFRFRSCFRRGFCIPGRFGRLRFAGPAVCFGRVLRNRFTAGLRNRFIAGFRRRF